MIQSVNLYTEDMRPRRDPLTLTQVTTVALAALVVLSLASFYAGWRADEAASARQAANARIAELRSALADAGDRLERRAEDPALRGELEKLSAALRRGDELVQQVERLASRSAEGFSPFMLGLARQAVDGVWLTTLEVDRDTGNLVLEGLTEDGSLVPLYLEQLRSEPAFSGRRFRYFRLDRPEDSAAVLGFRVAAQVGGQESAR
jgi:MSHA biogenesis protein MshI